MHRYTKTAALVFFFSAFISLIAFAQEDIPDRENIREDAVKVFIDCSSCDMSFTRQEIPWINYVRDVREAQVYVLVTRQNSGNGGDLYTYIFHGMEGYEGMDDTLTYTSNPHETSTEIRERRTKCP